MDEYQGIFRVVTPWDSWSASEPKVYTFRIDSPQQIVPLAELTLQLPQPESLTAARFAEERLYVVTYERVDRSSWSTSPTRPSRCRPGSSRCRAGSITSCRGATAWWPSGHDDTGGETNLAVSLFDVSDAWVPTLLSRVSAGSGWGWITDERDNYDKLSRCSTRRG